MENNSFYNKLFRHLSHPFHSLFLFEKVLIDKFFFKNYEKYCENFFRKKKLFKYFVNRSPDELRPSFIDCKRIYDFVRIRKPKCVLEFGSGFSTIAFALAAQENEEKDNIQTRIFSVDANIKWISNTEKKFSLELKKYVNFHFSRVKIINYKQQIATIHENLPDISPNFIYLDGPDPEDVDENINNLSFKSKVFYNSDNSIFFKSHARRIVSADPLMYESTAPSDFFILIDRRYASANFLEKNFMYDYKIRKTFYFDGCVTFEKKYQPYP
jgi:hypothetical protein